jgi:hypothetical protein
MTIPITSFRLPDGIFGKKRGHDASWLAESLSGQSVNNNRVISQKVCPVLEKESETHYLSCPVTITITQWWILSNICEAK